MLLNPKSLEKLRVLINEETQYRKGAELVQFFNNLGFNDVYTQGFPSRWFYTDEKLEQINGSSRLAQCIQIVFHPTNFIGRLQDLDNFISDFNRYLAFDKWKVIRNGADIIIQKLDKVEIDESSINSQNDTEDQFWNREFSNVSIQKIGLEGTVSEILEERIREIEKCYSSGAYLSVIVIAGSTLEGVFLGLANKFPRQFNQAESSPKIKGRVRAFHDWNLSAFIDVAYELHLVQFDIQRFSHALRDFRNYIHPYQQMTSGFKPRQDTAKICLQVLKAAISDISENISRF